MKKVLPGVILLIAFSACALAQEKPRTLLGSATDVKMNTFFWGPELKLHIHHARITEAVSPLFGAKAGWIINRKLLVGIGGWGKVARTTFYGHYTDYDDGQFIDNPNQRMAVGYGYGGLVLGYVHQSNAAVHVTFTSAFGIGTSNEFIVENDGDHGTTFNSPGFGVIEPTVGLEMNLTEYFRLEAGAGYRVFLANRFEQLSTNELSGITLQVTVKFGRY